VPAGAPSPDPWAWLKYGQKPIKGSLYPRGYYRCSNDKDCKARKQGERCRADHTTLIVSCTGEHSHPSRSTATPSPALLATSRSRHRPPPPERNLRSRGLSRRPAVNSRARRPLPPGCPPRLRCIIVRPRGWSTRKRSRRRPSLPFFCSKMRRWR
jgi:hypothetical protein